MDVGTIPTALFVVGAFALLAVLLRRLPPAEDDVAVVVTAILRAPVELDRPLRADLDEPVRWRLDQLQPRAADRSLFERPAGLPANSHRRVPKLTTGPHSSESRA
jgi:hypothetical protein